MRHLLTSPALAALVPADRLGLVAAELGALETRCEGQLSTRGIRVYVTDALDAYGAYLPRKRQILLSLRHVGRHGAAFVVDTVRHEYAHVLAHHYTLSVGHDESWAVIAAELGVVDIDSHRD